MSINFLPNKKKIRVSSSAPTDSSSLCLMRWGLAGCIVPNVSDVARELLRVPPSKLHALKLQTMWKRGATRVNTGFWFCRAMLPKRMTWLVLDVLLLSRGWRNDLNLIRPSEREAKTTWSNKYVRTTICCKLKTFADALHTRFEHLRKKKGPGQL